MPEKIGVAALWSGEVSDEVARRARMFARVLAHDGEPSTESMSAVLPPVDLVDEEE